uniref:Uncharacterized protein n=1 Tax=Alexandrium catenella TaxID=2925 RepID=A0A7S1S910_ALECA
MGADRWWSEAATMASIGDIDELAFPEHEDGGQGEPNTARRTNCLAAIPPLHLLEGRNDAVETDDDEEEEIWQSVEADASDDSGKAATAEIDAAAGERAGP